MPACDEEENLERTAEALFRELDDAAIPFEFIIVNDHSRDGTLGIAKGLAAARSEVLVLDSTRPSGFGRTIREGLARFSGEVVMVVMSDGSDDPKDVVRYYRKLQDGWDCVFGSRFRTESHVTNYPPVKHFANRIVNRGLQLLFWTGFNDLTNAFKAFRREVILDCGPYSSCHFNLTVEMSLSALIRRYEIVEIPIAWYGRTWGASKLSLWAMGRRYLSVVLKLFFERLLISDDLIEDGTASRGLAQGDPPSATGSGESR
jgi:dolichol-phosphate mannosyltransferase